MEAQEIIRISNENNLPKKEWKKVSAILAAQISKENPTAQVRILDLISKSKISRLFAEKDSMEVLQEKYENDVDYRNTVLDRNERSVREQAGSSMRK